MTGDPTYLVATDVGGTCTDTVILGTDGQVIIGKALSTPPNFADGVLNSIRSATGNLGLTLEALMGRTQLFIHGSTVVDNAILTRDGTPTGLLTTEGFEDTLHVTRGAYGRWAGLTEERIKHPVKTDRASALALRENVAGIPERVDSDGEVVLPLDEESVEQAIRFLVEDRGVSAIAISFLWSFLNPEHERRARDIVRRVAPDAYVSLSSDIAPVPGEYERTSTAVINAYAGQITNAYLTSLQTLLVQHGYSGATMVMQGYGGLLPADEAADRAVGMIESGPAAGVIGAKSLGGLMGDADVIAADMGGTTFKVGVIQGGNLEYAREPMVDRFHYLAPKIEVVSIGAGGGSIISLDPRTNVPRVGPRSAGARPGPICYGQGGKEPTLTDVMLLIGYMDPRQFLGGSITLDRDGAERLFREQIAEPLGMSVTDAAIGIYNIASAQIADLIREITVERGLDPRDFVLQSFGGSCGMLAASFGHELSVKRVVIPYTASVNCAFGLISADVAHEYSFTTTLPASTTSEEINAIFAPMEEQARTQLAAEGIAPDQMQMVWSVDLRYSRQVHEVTTPVEAQTPLDNSGAVRLIDDFEALYERKFGKGSAYREAGIEMTMFRLTARGIMPRPELPTEPEGDSDPSAAFLETREIYIAARDGMSDGNIYDFEKLSPGNVVPGPAVIHTPITTIAVPDRMLARMDQWRNIVVSFDD
ncbi:MAG: hydantoinase/oxoprolinase family protein [Pseudomonadota bacterium]